MRLYHNLSLGVGYDIMNAATLAFLALILTFLLRTRRQCFSQGIIVFIYLFFVFTDYIYINQFGTHLPFSTIEYLGEVSSFTSTIGVSLMDKSFLLLFVVPLAIFIFVGRRVERKKTQNTPLSFLTAGVTLVFLLVIGGLTGSYANSYVSKNINDPLTSSGLFYFYSSRNIEKEVNIEKPIQELQFIADVLSGVIPSAPKYNDFPLVRTHIPTTCKLIAEQNDIGKALCGIKKPNILFLMLESFRSSDIGIYGSELKLTPNFDRLSQQGVFFNNFYANGFQTRHGQVASYCSIMPNYGAPVMKRYADNSYFCLPEILKKQGYNTSWVNGSDAAFDGQINFLPKIGIDTLYDKFSFESNSETLGWGFSDEVMFAKWKSVLDQLNEPFFSTALTTTNHHPFDVPEAYKLYKNADDAEKYHEAMHYTDAMLGKFIKQIRSEPWYDNTLVFIYADTSNYQQPQKTPSNFEDFIKLRSQIPLLILGGQIKKNIVVDDYYSQIDFAPTIMDLMGIEYTAPWMGVSMLTTKQKAIAYTNRPGNYWAVMSQDGRYYREANQKDYFYGFNDKQREEQYRRLGISWIKSTQWLLQNNKHWSDSF